MSLWFAAQIRTVVSANKPHNMLPVAVHWWSATTERQNIFSTENGDSPHPHQPLHPTFLSDHCISSSHSACFKHVYQMYVYLLHTEDCQCLYVAHFVHSTHLSSGATLFPTNKNCLMHEYWMLDYSLENAKVMQIRFVFSDNVIRKLSVNN